MSHSITYEFDELLLLTTDGRPIYPVSGKAVIRITTMHDNPEIYDMDIEIEDMNGKRAWLRQKDDWYSLCERSIRYLWKDGLIDPYDGMEPEEFHGSKAEDIANAHRLNREAA